MSDTVALSDEEAVDLIAGFIATDDGDPLYRSRGYLLAAVREIITETGRPDPGLAVNSAHYRR